MENLTTLVHCATLAIALAVCLYLFVSVKRDVHVLEARYLRRGENLRKQLQELAQELEVVRTEIEKMDQRSDPAVIARTLGSGIRIQALRMIKHGQAPQHISAALGMTRTEVELLVKVQRLIAEPAVEAAVSPPSGLLGLCGPALPGWNPRTIDERDDRSVSGPVARRRETRADPN